MIRNRTRGGSGLLAGKGVVKFTNRCYVETGLNNMEARNLDVVGSAGVRGLVQHIADDTFLVPAFTFGSRFVKYNSRSKEGDAMGKVRGLMVHDLEGEGSTIRGGSTIHGDYGVDAG